MMMEKKNKNIKNATIYSYSQVHGILVNKLHIPGSRSLTREKTILTHTATRTHTHLPKDLFTFPWTDFLSFCGHDISAATRHHHQYYYHKIHVTRPIFFLSSLSISAAPTTKNYSFHWLQSDVCKRPAHIMRYDIKHAEIIPSKEGKRKKNLYGVLTCYIDNELRRPECTGMFELWNVACSLSSAIKSAVSFWDTFVRLLRIWNGQKN